MSNYAESEHLISRLGSELVAQLVTPTMPLSVDEYLDFLLDNTDGYIDGFLNKYYDTPICTDASNTFLREIALDITEYEIWKRSVADDVPTKYKTSYDHAQKVLDEIAAGTLAPFPDNIKIDNSSIDVVSDERVMGEDELSVY